jgi:hypothetical protein
MGELTLVKESFVNTLRSMLHNRIDYQKPAEDRVATTKRPVGSGRESDYEDKRPSKVWEQAN